MMKTASEDDLTVFTWFLVFNRSSECNIRCSIGAVSDCVAFDDAVTVTMTMAMHGCTLLANLLT